MRACATENPEASKVLSDWGLTLDSGPIALEGRVLPPEMIGFKNREAQCNEMADFSREAGRERVLVPVRGRGWEGGGGATNFYVIDSFNDILFYFIV